MKKHGYLGLLLAALVAVASVFTASAGTPQVDIKVVLTSVSGESIVLPEEDPSTSKLSAPLKAKFISSLTSDDGKEYVLFPKWTVTRIITDGEKTEITQGVDYTLSYKNNKKVAAAGTSKSPTVIIKGKGRFSGTATKQFSIYECSLFSP